MWETDAIFVAASHHRHHRHHRQSARKTQARRILDARGAVGESPGRQTDTGRNRSPPIVTSYEVGIDIRSNGRRLGFNGSQWEAIGRVEPGTIGQKSQRATGRGALGSKDHRSKVVENDTVAGTSSPGSITSKVAESDTAAGTSSPGSEIKNRESKDKRTP